jgi:hypothetical protein
VLTAADLHEQLSWHWATDLRPRLAGLSVDEALWEPGPEAWTIRDGRLESEWPTPVPAPARTIAWHLGQIGRVLSYAASAHFGNRTFDDNVPLEDLLGYVDRGYEAWSSGLLSAAPERLYRPHQGPPGTSDERYPLWAVVLHLNAEVLRHGACAVQLRELRRSGQGGS